MNQKMVAYIYNNVGSLMHYLINQNVNFWWVVIHLTDIHSRSL